MSWEGDHNHISSLCTCRYKTACIKNNPEQSRTHCIPGVMGREAPRGHGSRSQGLLPGMENHLLPSSRAPRVPLGALTDSKKGSKMIPYKLELWDAVLKL